MTGYIIRRLIALVFVMLAVSVIVFVLMNAVPGGPFTLGERGYSADALANLERKYGLDKPPIERYFNFLGSALRLDFGNSFAVAGNPPVTDVIVRTWGCHRPHLAGDSARRPLYHHCLFWVGDFDGDCGGLPPQ